MVVAFFILLIGLSPSIASWVVLRRADARTQARLQWRLESVAHRGRLPLPPPPDQHYIDGFGYVIGDISCRYNARSPYVRCAVNPTGPCETCRAYDSTLLADPDS
jgi:hypothetical protein